MSDPTNSGGTHRTAYDDFLDVLTRFKALSITALGSSAVVPYVAYVANLVPPFDGIILVTGLVEIVTLILVFQRLRLRSKKLIDRVLTRCVVFLFCLSTVYLVLFLLLTFRIGVSNARDVRGFICISQLAPEVMASCPFVSTKIVQNSEWDPYQVWLWWSVELTRALLTLIWLGCFFLLSFAIGAFLVYQTQVPSRKLKPPSA